MLKKSSTQEVKNVRKIIRQMIKEEITHYITQNESPKSELTSSPHSQEPLIVLGSAQPDPEIYSYSFEKPFPLPVHSQPFQPDYSHLETRPYLSRMV